MNKITRKALGLFLVAAMIFALIPGFTSEASAAVSTKAASTTNMQDSVTLHCWNWSFANIEANLDAIAAAGYTAVQTSPVQPLKESTKESWSTYSNQWWVYYQPTEFKINTASNNALGTKAQLKSLCEAAEKKGIKVIVDVVANHLADNGGLNISSAVPSYLKDNASYWHKSNGNFVNVDNWNHRYAVTQQCLDGLPDLNTGNADIQNYVLTFLKECVDVGVDGFRFDAAKHIETPDDTASGCASNFWPTVINGIKAYKSDIYVYGEILDGSGGDLSMSSYTKYMSITDNNWGDKVLSNVINSGNASNFYYNYDKGVSADKLVLWAESHDTYAGDAATRNVSATNINKAWALVTARADAMTLYLARPSSTGNKLGTASTNTGWDWKEVAAVNKFHTAFAGQSEYVSNNNGFAYVERGNSGIVIVNVGSSNTNVNLPVYSMANGTYTDQISGNTFTVSNGRITGNLNNGCGYAVIYNSCSHSWTSTGTTAATCTTDGTTNYKCSKCGETKSEVTATASGHKYVNNVCSVCGTAKPVDRVLYYNNTNNWSTVNIYYWSSANGEMVSWPGVAMTSVGGGVYSYTVPADADCVIFNNGTTKTGDLTIPADKNYYSNDTWTTYTASTCTHSSHNTSGKCTSCGVAVSHTYVNNVCSVCGAKKETTTLSADYYLIGYINGADYGCNNDSANLGDYKFVNGKVTVKFNSDSYVFVKTGDNKNWYMTDGWLGTDVTSATLYNTSAGINANKLYVPGGIELTLTLVENGNDTLTLSYAEAGCDHSYTSKITTAATCTSAGVETYTCSKCGDSYTETLLATGHAWVDATCTAMKTCSNCGATQGSALGHSYKSVVTAPTCGAGGYTTYTCSACGYSYVGNEVAATGAHNYTYAFVNKQHTLTCSICGDVISAAGTNELKFRNATLSLASDISVIFKLDIDDVFEVGYMVFEVNGEETYVYDYTIDESNGRKVFAYQGINPQMMGDSINCTIHAYLNGTEVTVSYNGYSVVKYCNSQFGKTDATVKQVCANLLNYGAAVQLKKGYKTDALVNANLPVAPETFPGVDAITNQQAMSGTANNVSDIKSVALQLSNKVEIKVGMVLDNPADYEIKVTIKGNEFTYGEYDLEFDEASGRYYLYFSNLNARDFDETITFVILKDGVEVSRTLTYSVNSYIAKNGAADTADGNTLRALYCYGKSTESL